MMESKKAGTDLKLMRERYKAAVDADSDNRKLARDDRLFVLVPGNQWDEKQRKARRGRPCYEFPILRSHWRQIVNDQKQSRASVKVTGIDAEDKEGAELRQGLIRNIERSSNAEEAYDNAFEEMTSGGFGAWRVVTRYSEDDGWNQDLAIEPIHDAVNRVWVDPDAVMDDSSDAKWLFVEDTISSAEFKRRYPDAEPGPKFEEDPFTFGILASHPDARAPGLVGDLKVITSTGDKWHGIPTRYYVQLLTQALTVREATGERIERAVLLSLHLDLHLEFRCQEVTLTPEDWTRAESIADYCARWWRDYVVTHKTPPNTVVDGGFIDLPTPGSVRVATDAEAALCAHIRRLQLEAKVTEHALKEAQRTLRTMMGTTATLTHNGRKVATLSRSTATRINPAIVRALSPEIAQAATTHTEQVRLLVKDVP